MYTTQSLDLHVRGFIRMRGGVIYREPTTMTTDILGYVGAKLLPSGKRMYMLEPGLYLVQFEEPEPESLDINTFFHIRQHELNCIGAQLSLNTKPFEGNLLVYYPLQIEENSKLGTLVFRTVYDNTLTDSIILKD